MIISQFQETYLKYFLSIYIMNNKTKSLLEKNILNQNKECTKSALKNTLKSTKNSDKNMLKDIKKSK